MGDEYRRFWIASSEAIERELLLATAFEAGAEGAEETESDGRFRACIYARFDRIEEIRTLVSESAATATEILSVERLPDVDWREAWKEGLEAICISPRLLVRPPFVEVVLEPSQREIIIDPGQAFGIGGHASTRLCLEWIDELAMQGMPMGRVLDAGTGSGVLALAALALGAQTVIGFDLDPVAIEAAKIAARENQLAPRAHFLTGPIEALDASGAPFPLVLANLLKCEMLPIAPQLARRVSRDGRLILAGLLEEDVEQVLSRFATEGLVEAGRRRLADTTGCWVGLCLAFPSER